MADIAVWVLEEFERRQQGEGLKREVRELSSMAISAISRRAEEMSSLKEMVEEKLRGLWPRSSFGLAAFDGVFSP